MSLENSMIRHAPDLPENTPLAVAPSECSDSMEALASRKTAAYERMAGRGLDVGSTALLVNPKSWNRLSADVQNKIWAYKISEIDPLIEKYFKDLNVRDWDVMINKGKVEPLKFPNAADGEKYLQTAYDAAWKDLLDNSPELGPKLKKILVK